MGIEQKTKVLLVEDSRSFAAILRKLINKQHGFNVDIAESHAELEQVLAEHKEQYFVAIVDYHLPDAPDGEAIDTVVNCCIPTIVYTGNNAKALEENLWHKGIADYANKSGVHNLEYVSWMVKRIHANHSIEVLVVDDSLVARKAIAAMLARQGFVLHLAESGKQALTLLDKHPKIRIAIVDCNMDEMDGFEVTNKIREKHSRATLEIIGISSQGGRNLGAQFIKAGASDFVLKPLIPEEFLSRVNNIVDRIEAYFELEELNQVKNQFLGTAAHDIRGPLGAIKTATEFLLKRTPSPERTDKLLNMILNSSSDLLGLLETLLDISVIESGVPSLNQETINVSETVEERIELYQSEASSKGITLQPDIASDVYAYIDIIKMKQVFDNLITNAIKYSARDSNVLILLDRNEKGGLTFSVRDAGPGIPEDEQKHLFKAFSAISTQTTGGEKKTGLGLAIAKSIVDAHDGKIYYCNSEDIHSTFYIDLATEPAPKR